MTKFTSASNLRDLNRFSESKVVFTGYYESGETYPYKKERVYKYDGNKSDSTFKIVFNSADREDF